MLFSTSWMTNMSKKNMLRTSRTRTEKWVDQVQTLWKAYKHRHCLGERNTNRVAKCNAHLRRLSSAALNTHIWLSATLLHKPRYHRQRTTGLDLCTSLLHHVPAKSSNSGPMYGYRNQRERRIDRSNIKTGWFFCTHNSGRRGRKHTCTHKAKQRGKLRE
jgi:hypothetical protein